MSTADGRWRLRDLIGFVACLFDHHDLRYVAICDWLECARCGERRLTEDELLHLRQWEWSPR